MNHVLACTIEEQRQNAAYKLCTVCVTMYMSAVPSSLFKIPSSNLHALWFLSQPCQICFPQGN